MCKTLHVSLSLLLCWTHKLLLVLSHYAEYRNKHIYMYFFIDLCENLFEICIHMWIQLLYIQWKRIIKSKSMHIFNVTRSQHLFSSNSLQYWKKVFIVSILTKTVLYLYIESLSDEQAQPGFLIGILILDSLILTVWIHFNWIMWVTALDVPQTYAFHLQ